MVPKALAKLGWVAGTTVAKRVLAAVPSGVLRLDRVLGCGGWPRGRIVEVFGSDGTGKTTLMLHAAANAQVVSKLDVAFVDAEHSLDMAYAKALGVDPNRFAIKEPDCGEDACDAMCGAVEGGGHSVVIVDSVAALTPRAELQAGMSKASVAQHARLMSRALRKVCATAARTKTLVLFTNQTRTAGIGGGQSAYQTTTGGAALRFYASIRVSVSRVSGDAGPIKTGSQQIGNRIRITTKKNKLAPPFRVAECDIIFGRGIDRTGGLLDEALDAGVVALSGSYYSFRDQRLGQGRRRVIAVLDKTPELATEIETAVQAVWVTE